MPGGQFKQKQKGYYNMENKEKLDRINDRLESFSPELDTREEIIRNVMDFTSERNKASGIKSLTDLLFGWTDKLWIRGGLITASMALVFVFAIQQFTIVNRIGQLETRMVKSNTEQIIRQQGEGVLLNSVIMQKIGESEFRDSRDSVTVADKDLRDLINSYSELQSRYEDLKREHYSQQFNGKINKQKL